MSYASVLSGKDSLLAGPDNSIQSYAWLSFEARGGSLWDPYQWGGHTFVGELQSALFYPLNQVLFLLDGPDLTSWGITTFLLGHVLLAAVFTYTLLRVLGIACTGAVVGGLAFALGGYMTHRLGAQSQIFASAVWVPLVLCLFHLAITRAVWFAVPAGATLGVSLLAGHIQPPAFVILLIAAYGLWFALRAPGRRAAVLRVAASFAVVLAVGGALSAVALLPSLEYAEHAVRFISEPEPVPADEKLPYETVGHKFVLAPGQTTAFLSPAFATVDDGQPYTGIVVLLLAAVGLVRAPRRWAVFWGGVVVVSVLYAMGHRAGIHRVAYELVPLIDRVREPVRALMVTHLALAVLAGYGAAAMSAPRFVHARAPRHLVDGLALAAIGAAAAGIVLVTALDGRPVSSEGEGALIAAGLSVATLATIAARRLGWLTPATAVALCAGLLLLDLAPFAQSSFQEKSGYDGKTNLDPDRFYRRSDVVRFLEAKASPYRVSNPKGVLPPNIGDVQRLELLHGHGASLTKETYAIMQRGGAPPSPLHDLLSVRYAVVSKPVEGWRTVLVSRDGHGRVVENPAPLPRAWLASGWEVVPKWRRALDRVLEPGFPYRRSVVLDAAPSARPPGPGGRARVLRRQATVLEFEARAPRGGVLITSELFYPGWRAEVDGAQRRILRADGILRAVEVPAGTHRVTMTYRPTGWTPALVLSLTAVAVLLVACAAAAVGRRRRAQVSPSRTESS